MNAVRRVHANPSHIERKANFDNVHCTIDGVRIQVRMNKRGDVITAHPLDGHGVMRNSKTDGRLKAPVPLGSVQIPGVPL
ncbi:hypothetical protein [Skermania sp. ID1734]|uniref:hypothetical protein n=1 Tax=Skermania sp. ID1734 TaxID=2597516 RepID=UPI001C8F943D